MFVLVYNYKVNDYDWLKIEAHELRFPGLMYDIHNKIILNSFTQINDILRKIAENSKRPLTKLDHWAKFREHF